MVGDEVTPAVCRTRRGEFLRHGPVKLFRMERAVFGCQIGRLKDLLQVAVSGVVRGCVGKGTLRLRVHLQGGRIRGALPVSGQGFAWKQTAAVPLDR